MEVSEEVRGMIMQFQAYQQQSQMIIGQKDATKAQLMEIDKTLEELEKTGEKEIYKSVGPILIKTNREGIKKDLSEKKEMLELRLKTMDSEDKKTKEKIKDLQEKIQSSLAKKQ
ncbi:MAG: prefoldin subunit beta [Candidatus Aenigmarchaeota archaeon]|nr:prefoldin subunit beta [Candidatus Aenigmarchaeota archaeon]